MEQEAGPRHPVLEERLLEAGTILLLLGVPLACSTWLAQAVEAPKLFLFLSATVLVLVAFLMGLSRGSFSKPRHEQLNLPLLAFFAWWAVRSVVALGQPEGLESLLIAAGLGTLVLVWSCTGCRRRWVRWTRYLLAALAFLTAYSLVQRFGLDPVAWQPPSTYPNMIRERTIATMGNPNYLGAFMAGVLPLVLLLPRGAPLFSIALATIVLIQNRSTWLALALSCGLLLVLVHRSARERARAAAGAIAAGLVLAALGWVLLTPPNTRPAPLEQAAATRLYLWKSALFMAADHPLAGVGPGSYPYEALPYRRLDSPFSLGLARLPEDPHNEFLRVLAELGAPGLLLFLAGIVKGLARDREPQRLAGLTALLICLLFISAPVPLQILLVFLLATPAPAAEPARPGRLPPGLAAGGLLVWILATLLFLRPLRAEYHIWWGDEYVALARIAPERTGSLELYQKAIDQYGTALALAWPGRDPWLWVMIGGTYAAAYEQAAAPEIAGAAAVAYSTAARLEPRNPVPYAGRAELLSLEARLSPLQREPAVEMWREAVRRDPYNPKYLAALAGELAEAGSFEESAGYFRDSLDSYESGPVCLQYGRVLCRLGLRDEATGWLARARTLDPALEPRVRETLEKCGRESAEGDS